MTDKQMPPWPPGPVCFVDLESQVRWLDQQNKALLQRLRVAVRVLEDIRKEAEVGIVSDVYYGARAIDALSAIGDIPNE